MTCPVCGAPCVVEHHTFIEGYPIETRKLLIERKQPAPEPRVVRQYDAPLYFSDPALGGGGAVFCSAACSLAHTEPKRAAA